jgi:uncharacterized protein
MNISGSYTLNAPREQVWNALLDPDLLKRAIPGCESLEPTGDNQYAVRLNVAVAGVKGVYQGTLQMLDAQKPESYRVVLDGAGTRGIVHSDGVLRLETNAAGTTDLHYTGQAQLGGALASLGAQVASGAANMLVKQYFGRMADLLPAMPAPAPVAASAAPPVPEPDVALPPAEQPSANAPAAAAPVEMLSTAAPVDSFMPSPTAPIIAPRPPAEHIAPAAPTASTATPSAAPAAAETSAAPASTAASAPVANAARQPRLSDRSSESKRRSAGFIGLLIAVVAVVVVVVIVLVVVGAFR